MFDRPLDHTEHFIDTKFARKPDVAEANKKALNAGYNYAANTHAFASTYKVAAAPLEKGVYRSIDGNQAAAWGFIAASEKS